MLQLKGCQHSLQHHRASKSQHQRHSRDIVARVLRMIYRPRCEPVRGGTVLFPYSASEERTPRKASSLNSRGKMSCDPQKQDGGRFASLTLVCSSGRPCGFVSGRGQRQYLESRSADGWDMMLILQSCFALDKIPQFKNNVKWRTKLLNFSKLLLTKRRKWKNVHRLFSL